jgi:poly(A) polymerase/tRNA nucleotidyltransferase (CCA-adding enzyme)
MDRPDDVTLSETTAWLADKHAQAIAAALGGAVYFVGGCVRDALLGLGRADVDMATPLRPETVTAHAEAAGFKVVPTGIEHGTVTVVAGGTGYEITSFRRDVQTDGRRAVVAFSEDIAEDARRRDFTLNALYATPRGLVLDPLGTGIADCLDRRIRFIEDADRRIREDYLRILRYFRFHATYAKPQAGFDADALDAIARNTAGLETLSAERVGAEMTRLLAAADPAPAVAAMRQTGCLARVLPGSDDRYLAPVVHNADALSMAPDPILRLAALGGEDAATRFRLSRLAARRLRDLQAAASSAQSLAELAYREGAEIALGAAVLRAAFSETVPDPSVRPEIEAAARAKFPVTAKDLMPAFSGKALGEELARLEARWIASGFALSREDLMKQP